MRVELSRFRVLPGKSERVDEWLTMLNAGMDECLQTLDREGMKVEIIFREVMDGREFLFWFSIQEEGGEPLATSPFEIDALHARFFEECLDHRDHCRRDAQPQVVMVPESIARAMCWQDPASAVVPFSKREIVIRPKSDERGTPD